MNVLAILAAISSLAAAFFRKKKLVAWILVYVSWMFVVAALVAWLASGFPPIQD